MNVRRGPEGTVRGFPSTPQEGATRSRPPVVSADLSEPT
jgi:hypothetical protein